MSFEVLEDRRLLAWPDWPAYPFTGGAVAGHVYVNQYGDADLPYEKNMQARLRLSCFDPATGERLWNKEQELEWGSEKAPRVS